MSKSNRRRIVAAMVAASLSFCTLPASAQGPTSDKPVRVILPVSAGSGLDVIMRAVSPSLSKALGQPVFIDNLPGAGGITGTSQLVKSAPDGLTLGVVSNNHAVNPSVYKKMPFDSIADITPISVLGATPFVIVVNPKRLPAKGVKDLAPLLKAKPGAYNFASSGNGTIIHLAAEMFLSEANVQMTHIPYKGTGPMIADLIGGQVDLGVVAAPAVQGYLKTGQLHAIGVGSPTRVASLPDVPTIAEQGLPDYQVEGWFAVIAPAKLPAADVKRIHDAFVVAMASPEVRDAMARQGNIVNPGTPEAAAKFIRAEVDRYARLVKKAGIQLE